MINPFQIYFIFTLVDTKQPVAIGYTELLMFSATNQRICDSDYFFQSENADGYHDETTTQADETTTQADETTTQADETTTQATNLQRG